MFIEEKLCPYCYKSIKGNYGTADEDLPCPQPDCGKIIPKIYLQYPNKHVVSIICKTGNNFHDFGYEAADYAKKENAEGITSRAEYYESADNDVTFILYEYLKEEYSTKTQTVVLAIHKCVWDDESGRPVKDIEAASSILLNLDISELKSLYLNLGIKRSRVEFENWKPRNQGRLVREVSEYLIRNQINRRVAILFGNSQCLRGHTYINEEKRYQSLIMLIGNGWWKLIKRFVIC